MFKWYSREFQKRLDWNDGPDRQYGKWKLVEVNGTEMLPGYLWEFDFWCSDGKGVYILRLRWENETSFHIIKDKGKYRITYLVALCHFESVTDELIQSVLHQFDFYGIPRWKNKGMNLTLPQID